MVRLHIPYLLTALGAVLVAAKQGNDGARCTTFNIPSVAQNGTSNVQFTSSAPGLDAPKVNPVNGSTYDWWYFDVVDANPASKASVVAAFFASSHEAFALLDDEASLVTVGYVWMNFENGTMVSFHQIANGATIVLEGDSSNGVWHESGMQWTMDPTAKNVVITFDIPGNLAGTVTLQSTAPGHYPCGPVEGGQTMQVMPHVGWANLIPDGNASVDLLVKKTPLKFRGVGYHDKNWGDKPFTASVSTWYWGHGRVGPYSIVWFDVFDPTGQESVSAYVSKNDAIIVASCKPGSIKVRPMGNASFPPFVGAAFPEGYHMVIDMADEGTLTVNATINAPNIGANPVYFRGTAHLSAVVTPKKGKATTETGVALLEQFELAPPA
ncbi:hypothetical protein GGX14DRAFT_428695 [Mycena pura]|uniref:Hydroxyneurosporene synthase n=1 Tax=Mycena pura TaxID=153505 RepID=A0AAD7E0V9_9AGAR|nr:hypothetical protein GGX14DRAFT_428695 [Mycena pura]